MITLPGGAEMEMIWCPPGEFMMGSPDTEEGRCDDEILHRVTLTEGFWLGKYPVTQAQWKSVMGNYSSLFTGDYTLAVSNPRQLGLWIGRTSGGVMSKCRKAKNVDAQLMKASLVHIDGNGDWRTGLKNGTCLIRSLRRTLRAAVAQALAQQEAADKTWRGRVRLRLGAVLQSIFAGNNGKTAVQENTLAEFTGNDAMPVGNVSWDNCQEFIQKVNAQLNCGARLPTEAEWEYACRAGTKTAYFWGDVLNGNKANCDGNYPLGTEVKGPYVKGLSLVGQYPANPWGLYDMHGNIWEWCCDYYGDYPSRKDLQSNRYSRDAIDPTGPASGEDRVLRGGSWYNLAQNCRSANRDRLASCDSDNNIGFRLCCSAAPRG